MTVQELIDELNNIEDKSKEVTIASDPEESLSIYSIINYKDYVCIEA